jgi:hypothetical protein
MENLKAAPLASNLATMPEAVKKNKSQNTAPPKMAKMTGSLKVKKT